MSITIDQPQDANSTPSAQFHAVGDHIVGGIVNVEEIQSFSREKDGNKTLHWWDQAQTQPKMMKVVTVLVSSASGVTVGGESGDREVEAGDIVTRFISGQRWKAYHEALKGHGPVDVGDVMFDKLTELAKNDNPAWSPIKVHDIKLRKPEAKDGDLADRCVAAYHELQSRPAVDAAPAPSAPAGDDAEEPF